MLRVGRATSIIKINISFEAYSFTKALVLSMNLDSMSLLPREAPAVPVQE